jgi:hypothetical protein
MGMALSKRQADFVETYLLTNDAKKAALSAGYSLNGIHVQTYRLLHNASVVDEIERRRREIIKEKGLTKETFIDFALNDYKSVDVDSANRPRFLHLAGQASGIIGSEAGNTTTLNLTLNKNTLIASTTNEQLEHLQKMLEAE